MRKGLKALINWTVWLIVLNCFVAAQQPQKEYRFIASSNSSTLEQEINGAAKEGFRLHLISETSADAHVGVVMARVGPSSSKNEPTQYEYKVLGTRKVSTMRKELDEAAGQGYELRGLTANTGIMFYSVSETIAFLERQIGKTSPRYEYQFLTAIREKELQKSIELAVGEGFHPAALSVNKDNNAASFLIGLPLIRMDLIMQRPIGFLPPTQSEREYRLISTLKPSTLEKEIKQASEQGWRFHQASLLGVAMMARDTKARPEHLYDYQMRRARRTGTLQKVLQEAGSKGWTYRGASGLFSILEQDRNGQNPPHEYKLIAATRKKTTSKEIEEAVSAGYEVIDLLSIGEYVLILERLSTTK